MTEEELYKTFYSLDDEGDYELRYNNDDDDYEQD